MNIFVNKNKYVTGVLFLMLSVVLQAQDYGALKYTLQGRPAKENFKKDSFSDHLFFSGAIGPWGVMTNSDEEVGVNAALFLGKWLTPIHGIRMGGNIGYLPTGAHKPKTKMIGGSFDYMLNISSLTYGYDYNRRLELLGIAGIDGGFSKTKEWKLYGGVHLGLQGKWHVSPILDFFVEPRIGWYSDQLVQRTSWRKYQSLGSLYAGFTYNMVPDEYRPSAEFKKTTFTDHMFVTLSGGPNILKVPGMKETWKKAGLKASLGVGKWFTPSSALRLSGVMGYFKNPVKKNAGDLKHVDFRTDYMLNMNSAFGGYDPDRIFSLIGIAGINLAMVKNDKADWKLVPGIGVGAQANFRVSSNLELFMEPRVNMYSEKYAGGVAWAGKDWTAEMNLGLTAYLNRGESRPKQQMESLHFFDNMFMTSGAGAQILLTGTSFRHSGMTSPLLSLSIGKWFTPVSGVRLTGVGGYFAGYTGSRQRYPYAAAGIDYLLNIHSALEGYNPERSFELIGTIGANLVYVGKSTPHLHPGFGLGLQGLWHVTPTLGIYVEPQIRGYGDKFAPGSVKDFGFDGLVALNAGVHYTFVPYQKAKYREQLNENDRRMFASAALGTHGVFAANRDIFKKLGIATQLSFGKWHTPLSAFRVNGTLVRSKATSGVDVPHLYYAGLGLDYMMSLGTLAKGYDPERIFDIVPYVGVNMGISYVRGKTNFVPGLDAGAQFKFRLSPAIDLFIEPTAGIRSDKYDGQDGKRFDKVMGLFGGFSYKPQGLSWNSRQNSVEGFVPQNFVSLGLGTGLQKNSNSHRDLSLRTDINAGRYFTAVSGVRLGLTNSNYKIKRGDKDHINLTSIHGDYLFDITTLLNGYAPERRFTLTGITGLNVNFSSATGAKTVLGADLGVQASWKVSNHFDIYGEPMLNVYNGKADGPFYSGTSASCNITIGTTYRF